MALYPDPEHSDIEIFEAIRYHFPISVKRAMSSMQLASIGEALELLKKIEIMETQEMYNKGHNLNSNWNQQLSHRIGKISNWPKSR
jgi:hypothetical protein